MQLGQPLGGQQRDGFERWQAVEQRLRGEDELPQILRQRHDMGPAGGRIGAELRAHPLFGGHHLQQGALMASCSFCPLALNKRG